MKLIKGDPKGTCSWCGKPKDVIHVAFDDGTAAVLCWSDLRRMASLKLPHADSDPHHSSGGIDT